MRRQTLPFSVYPAIMTIVWLYSLAVAMCWAEPCPCTPSPCEEDEEGASWIFEPSYYSHDPDTGRRVAQYSPTPTVYLPYDPTYQESGFHYTQQIMRGPYGSVDAYHLIQSWGQGDQIRPYGEWAYPYRAGATPYGPWGNPQGPWTLPFDSWQNPYGLGRLPNPPWPVYPYYQTPFSVPYGNYNSPPMPGMGNGAMPMPGSRSNPTPMPNGRGNFNNGGARSGFGADEDE
jgi:hypothetical protein